MLLNQTLLIVLTLERFAQVIRGDAKKRAKILVRKLFRSVERLSVWLGIIAEHILSS